MSIMDDPVSTKIILAIGKKTMKISELETSGIAARQTAHTRIENLIKAGYIDESITEGFPRTRNLYLTQKGLQVLERQSIIRNIDLGLEVRRLFFVLKDLYEFWHTERPQEVELKDFVKFILIPLSSKDTVLLDDFAVDQNSLDNLDILIAKLEQCLSGMLPAKLLKYQKPSLNNPSTDALRLELWTLKVYTYERGETTFKFEPETFYSPRICTANKLAELDLPDELKSPVLDGLNYLKDFVVKYTLYFGSASNPLGDELKC